MSDRELWKMPDIDRCEAQSRKGPVTIESPVCRACANQLPNADWTLRDSTLLCKRCADRAI